MATRGITVVFRVSVVILLCVSTSIGNTLSLFNNCDSKIILGSSDQRSVAIEGPEWSSSPAYTCILTFESPKKFNLIYSHFKSFRVNDGDIQIVLESSSAKGNPYNSEGTFDRSTPPSLSTPDRAERFFRIKVKREHLQSYDLSILIDVFTEEYYKQYYSFEKSNSLEVGAIAGIVIGSIIVILILVTVVVCCVIGMKYPNRRGSIYSVARRLSIFATPPTTGRTEGSDTESDLKPHGKRDPGGKINPAFTGKSCIKE